MRFRTFLFDLDGTLVDHFAAIHRSYAHTMGRLGLPEPTLAQVRAAVGGGLEKAIAVLVPAGHREEALRIYREHWDRTMLDDVALLPGADGLVRALHARGAALAVFSNKHGGSCRRVCEKLGLSPFLGAVVGAQDTPWFKPAPEFTAHMLRLLGGGPATTLLVGDSPYDVQAAHNGGLQAWCVTTGTHDAGQLRAAGADAVYGGLGEMGRALGVID